MALLILLPWAVFSSALLVVEPDGEDWKYFMAALTCPLSSTIDVSLRFLCIVLLLLVEDGIRFIVPDIELPSSSSSNSSNTASLFLLPLLLSAPLCSSVSTKSSVITKSSMNPSSSFSSSLFGERRCSTSDSDLKGLKSISLASETVLTRCGVSEKLDDELPCLISSRRLGWGISSIIKSLSSGECKVPSLFSVLEECFLEIGTFNDALRESFFFFKVSFFSSFSR
mmetsp:Transcript_20182/g.34038  ORF Transcript_20182/g.34038 Transcript_20182/m.34038 type:complete len:226 (+) Transcript_20182:3356-4033(+)